MLRIYNRFAIITLIILLSAATGYANNGSVFLNIPNGGRETAMGETGVSHAEGASAQWWNPALLGTGSSQVDFQLFRWIADASGSFGAIRARTSWGGLGAYYFAQGMDGFEVRDRPGPPQSEFSIHHSIFGLGGAAEVYKGVKAGLIFKSAYEDIYSNDTQFFAVDMGLYRDLTEFLALGISLNNVELGNDTEDSIPRTLRAGLSGTRTFGEINLNGSIELASVSNDQEHIHFGIEAGWQNTLFARSGFATGYDSHSYSFGLGVHLRQYRMDFSSTPFQNSLGNVWRVSFGMKL